MVESPKILIVYPHNFFKREMGIDSRYIKLLSYFKHRNFTVDLFSLENFVSTWKGQNPQEDHLINRLFLYDFAQGCREQSHFSARSFNKKSLKRFFSPSGRKGAETSATSQHHKAFHHLPDYAFKGMKKAFKRIVEQGHYQFILISYAYWAGLLDTLTPQSFHGQTILDLSDFLSLNLYEIAGGNARAGHLLEEEINRVNRFDKVMCISRDEQWFFSQWRQKNNNIPIDSPIYYYVPHFEKNIERKRNKKPTYDLLYIASDNPFNIDGADWFFREVFPLLKRNIKLLVVGKITQHITNSIFPDGTIGENITLIPFAPNLDDVYGDAAISICPLLGGTGIKIKVIEALNHQLPVVTTSKGVAGFPVKSGNGCLVADKPGDFAGHIQRLLEDKGFYHLQSETAKQFFRDYFEETRIYNLLDEIFNQSS